MESQTFLQYLEKRPESKMNVDFASSQSFFAQVQRRPKPFVTIVVGGTNGKGSMCQFLTSIYLAHGYRVGTYTSPHLLSIRERIQIDGQSISENDFRENGDQFFLKFNLEQKQSSYFESLTFFAYDYFANKEVDVAIFEVGLGGRWDSTNALEKDAVIIGKIDMDHMHILGPTLESIAKEKIALTTHAPISILARQERPAAKVIEDTPFTKDQIILKEGEDFFHSGGGESFFFQLEDHRIPPTTLGLQGSWQSTNASCAITTALMLRDRLPVHTETIVQGLQKARLMGRLERWIRDEGEEIWLDVAHNQASIDALTQFFCQKKMIHLHTLLSSSADKEFEKMIESLESITDRFWFCENKSSRSWNLDQANPKSTKPYTCYKSFDKGLLNAIGEKKFPILCTGSFYFYSEFHSILEKIGFHRS
ncbi:MAG: Mur ligase family protein [Bdellovibrionota bacterium]